MERKGFIPSQLEKGVTTISTTITLYDETLPGERTSANSYLCH
jgi:hypothetical protein